MSIGPLKYQDFIIANSQISSSRKFWKDPAPLDTFVAASRRPPSDRAACVSCPRPHLSPSSPAPSSLGRPREAGSRSLLEHAEPGEHAVPRVSQTRTPGPRRTRPPPLLRSRCIRPSADGGGGDRPRPPAPCTKSLKSKAGVGPVRSLTDRQTNTAHLLLPAPSPSHLQTGQRIEHRIKIHQHVWLPGCSPGASVGLNP